jgi:aspartate-semialdehyde dehydrogenase
LGEDLYSEEEKKMVFETRKILEDPEIKVSATCVRVPVLRAHAVSMNVSFQKGVSLEKARFLLEKAPNVTYYDQKPFATPHIASYQENIFVSRLRVDQTCPNTLELFAVGDQLLKGAALNAWQIACLLFKKKWLPTLRKEEKSQNEAFLQL